MYRILLLSFIVGISSISAQNVSTVREIYDYEIGDEFHYSRYFSPSMPDWFIIKVDNKYYSPTLDSVFYHLDVVEWTINPSNGNQIIKYYLDTLMYSKLDSAIHDSIDTTYSNTNFYNNRKVNLYSYYIIGEYTSHYYIEGVGYYYDGYDNMGYSWWQEPRYYKKGNETWGTPLIVSIAELQPEIFYLKAFPNPASSYISFEFINGSFSFTQIEILDVFGQQKMLRNIFRTEKLVLDVEDLESGLYFYRLYDSKANLHSSGKFMIIK